MIRRTLATLAVGIVALSFPVAGQLAQGDADAKPGELLVKFQDRLGVAARESKLSARAVRRIRRFEQLGIEHVRLPPGQTVAQAMAALRADPDLVFVQPNYRREVTAPAPPNDPYWLSDQLWGLARIGAPLAWAHYGTGSSSVVVADIDTGVNYQHPDLAANMWVNPGEVPANGLDDDGNGYVDDVHGIDTVNGDGDPMDDHGHGTHVAGTMAGVGNNGVGVVGVSWSSKILACKFIGANGIGFDSDAIECLNYVVGMKQRGVDVRVTNNSWGAPRGSSMATGLLNAFNAAGNAGIVNVVAAGNSGANNDTSPFDPASLPAASIIVVAASEPSDARAGFSNYGAVSVDLAAPGTGIVSTLGSGYGGLSGTSMAAPHVTGAVALLASLAPSTTVAQMKSALLDHVDLVGWSGLVASGGRLNVQRSAAALGLNAPPAVTVTSPVAGQSFTAPASITIAATATDIDDTIGSVSFYADGVLLGTDTSEPYTWTWTGVAVGSFTLTAVATDARNGSNTSQGVGVTVTAPGNPNGTSATFLGIDSTTQGSWRGVYGADGHVLSTETPVLPTYAQVAITGGPATHTWTAATAELRALQRPAGSSRFAATWYNNATNTYAVDLELVDNQPHDVAFYVLDWDVVGRGERFDVFDAVTGVLLDTQTVGAMGNGLYLRWTLRGHVRIVVTGTAGVNAVLSGLFLGAGTPVPSVALTSPATGTAFPAPASIVLTATAQSVAGIASVQFFGDNQLLATDTLPPYTATWIDVPVGAHTLKAVATDMSGRTADSTPVGVTVTAPGNPNGTSATFLGIDSTTQGSWRGVYGADGHVLSTETPVLPTYAQVAITGGPATHTWTAATAELRALQRPAGSSRFAATWYNNATNTYAVDLELVDNQPHDVAFYVLDWDVVGRGERFDVFDAVTGVLLDTQTVGAMGNGLYLRWTLRGHVRIVVTGTAGVNAVLSGLFLGAGTPVPSVALTSPATGTAFPAPASIVLTATAQSVAGIASVQFFGDNQLLATDTLPPYTATWIDVPVGAHTLKAVATDMSGRTADSTPVGVTVTAPGNPNGTSATFLGIDSTTQGSWRGVYGADGHVLSTETPVLPTYAQVAITGGPATHTWTAATAELRALQRPAGSSRFAATWYNNATNTYAVDLELVDNQPHDVAFYVLDWDVVGRGERFDVFDAVTGVLLDTQTVGAMGNGLYLRWTLRGHVRIVVTGTAGVNAVLSGLFLR